MTSGLATIRPANRPELFLPSARCLHSATEELRNQAKQWQPQRMSMRPTREDPFIKRFLSAYERGSWADATLVKPDSIDRTNPAVDQIATRRSDRKTLAIEHTIIEPYVGDKEDFAFFQSAFLGIEKDETLLVPGLWIQVFVPVGTLWNQPPKSRDAIVQSVHCWIKSNRAIVPKGISQHPCSVTGVPGELPFDITLSLKVVPLQDGSVAEHGTLHVRRQEIDSSLGDVIVKSLTKKLPKLVNTSADKRILLLERQHMNLFPERILGEIEKRRASFPDLGGVDEIWIIETIFYETAFGGTCLCFELYKDGKVVGSFDFEGEKLMTKFEDGVVEVIHRFGDSST
jgi:hypothetical protein